MFSANFMKSLSTVFYLPLCYIKLSGGVAHRGPYFTPCTFPTPLHQPSMYRTFCDRFYTQLPFLCDLHQQISHSGSDEILKVFNKNRAWFTANSTTTIAVVVVNQLALPRNEELVYKNRKEYGCLFDKEDDCFRVDQETIHRFVSRWKTFSGLYVSLLYDRWFDSGSTFDRNARCSRPNVLALIATDGLTADHRKLPIVRVYSGDPRLTARFFNAQLESINAILQGWPLHSVIADLLDEIGYQMSDFQISGGKRRWHLIPGWAINAFLLCTVLVALALMIEWYVVRRKLAVKKSTTGASGAYGGKSKTHLMF